MVLLLFVGLLVVVLFVWSVCVVCLCGLFVWSVCVVVCWLFVGCGAVVFYDDN